MRAPNLSLEVSDMLLIISKWDDKDFVKERLTKEKCQLVMIVHKKERADLRFWWKLTNDFFHEQMICCFYKIIIIFGFWGSELINELERIYEWRVTENIKTTEMLLSLRHFFKIFSVSEKQRYNQTFHRAASSTNTSHFCTL